MLQCALHVVFAILGQQLLIADDFCILLLKNKLGLHFLLVAVFLHYFCFSQLAPLFSEDMHFNLLV